MRSLEPFRERVRLLLFTVTGLAVPFYAFPPFQAGGRAIDLATVFAALFVLTTPPRALVRRLSASPWLCAFALVPLLALVHPEAPPFSYRQFAVSYGHWLLVTGFFVSALLLDVEERKLRLVLGPQVVLATLVALFAAYQVLAWTSGQAWPLTGPTLCPLQREPLRLSAYTAGFIRPTSILLEPGWLGAYLAWALACAGALALSATGVTRAASAAATSIMAAASIATVSLGAYVDLTAALAALASTALVRGRLRARALGSLLAAALLLAGAGLLTPPGKQLAASISGRARLLAATLLERRDGAGPGQDRSAELRFDNVDDSLRLFRRRPLTGIGIGQFPAFQAGVHRKPVAENQSWIGWLGIAAEMGLFGPVLLALPLVFALRRGGPQAATGQLLLPAVVAVLAVQPLHGACYIDLAWWFPASLAALASESRPRS